MNGEINKHNRHSIRLKGFDYSEEGVYFVTIVTHNRDLIFGKVIDGEMVLNEYGRIVELTWNDLINHVRDIELGEFIVMPNHIHGIIVINEPVGAGSKPAPEIFNNSSSQTPSRAGRGPAPTGLPEIVRQFKCFSSKRINLLRGTIGTPVWQRNYYDHIIRDEKDYNAIANYIAMNPSNWMKDDDYS